MLRFAYLTKNCNTWIKTFSDNVNYDKTDMLYVRSILQYVINVLVLIAYILLGCEDIDLFGVYDLFWSFA